MSIDYDKYPPSVADLREKEEVVYRWFNVTNKTQVKRERQAQLKRHGSGLGNHVLPIGYPTGGHA